MTEHLHIYTVSVLVQKMPHTWIVSLDLTIYGKYTTMYNMAIISNSQFRISKQERSYSSSLWCICCKVVETHVQ